MFFYSATNDFKMATGPKIVHKQFNSPIGLYSQQNIKETLNKHLQNLDNGTVGFVTQTIPGFSPLTNVVLACYGPT